MIGSVTPLTAAGGRASNSKSLRINDSTASETTTAPGGARPEIRVATLAADPEKSPRALSRYTRPQCTPTRTLTPKPNRRCDLITEPGHLPRDLQPGLYRAAHIVVVRNRMTEHRQQPITLGGADMPLVPVHDAQHLFAVPTYHQAVRLRLHLGGQRRRIHQIGKEHRQPPDLTSVPRGCQQVFGVGRTVSHLDPSRSASSSVTVPVGSPRTPNLLPFNGSMFASHS